MLQCELLLLEVALQPVIAVAAVAPTDCDTAAIAADYYCCCCFFLVGYLLLP